ncbi:HNH endonuclease signature motif containing protein [Conyzicola nivalis]|nr:HNH endonuclease signature motif containing protein [Conyzicola nivalis]
MTGLQGFPPGVEAPRVAMLRGSLGGVLDTVEAVDRIAGAIAAARAELIDAARRTSEAIAAEGSSGGPLGAEPHGWNAAVRARRELAFDLAARLRIPERTAETLIGESQRLVQSLPDTHTALGAGEISYRHAQVIIDQTAGLSDIVTAEFESTVLPRAKELTVSKFKNDARKKREALDPDSIERRHRVAIEDRTTWIDPQQDGMAILSTLMTAEAAVAIMDRITRIALANGTDGTEDGAGNGAKRTLAQRKADAVTDLLLDGDLCTSGDPVPHGIRPQVLVTVPVLTLLGQAETPAHLDGYGPISPDTARDLAVKAPGFARILTDPVTSAILDFDRSKYAVPADLKQVVRLQHETCTAPGCNKRATHCQLDHTQDWAGEGTTCLANLSPLCTEHHNLKHHTRVKLRKLPDGTMEWTTATGKTVTVRPTNILGSDMLRRGSPGAGPSGNRSGDTGGTAPPDIKPPPLTGWDEPPDPEQYPF